jgi:N-methylhydantoinase A
VKSRSQRLSRSPNDARPDAARARELVVGVDTGGTFTDIVFRDGARTGTYKLLSTPDDPARAVLAGLAHLFGERPPERLTYGTTVATNAMLERRGAVTALVTTEGFEDVLEIGRQARPALYDLEPYKPPPLVAERLRFGVAERTLHDGTVERPPASAALAALAGKLRRAGVRSIAVCLLHAHVEPANERKVAQALARLGMPVTVSHELCAVAGEYERTSTAVANAYVRPAVAVHLEKLARRSRARTVRVMQSNGGAIGIDTAAREPMRTMLSGPAGGAAAAAARARAAGFDRVISFDMGGTSTDVALIDRDVPRRAETWIGGVPLSAPSLDIHTVGAGGGSIASVDTGGALKVGPESAGADPGPACYGRGSWPTVTDANLVLGRLRPEAFLGGGMRLDCGRARAALATLARAMGARSPEVAAEGVVRVVEGAMERAIRVITVERGQDPRTCALLAFGGAAGLHACGLADALGIRDVLVPRDPGLLSAWGVLDGPVIRDLVRPLRKIDPTFAEIGRAAARAEREMRRELQRERLGLDGVDVKAWVRMRYHGQSIEIEVPVVRRFRRVFEREHMRLLHTADRARSVEVVGLRLTATGDRGRAPGPRRRKPALSTPPPARRARLWMAGRARATAIFAREDLRAGARITGPAIVTEYSSTVFAPRAWLLSVDAGLDLRLRRTRTDADD